MAEIIGLAASLITLAGASAQLARTLLEVANVIKSAEYEARLIAADISVFSSSLTQLSMVVDLPHSKTEKLREITVVLIGACQTLIEDLRMLIGEPIQNDPRRRAFTISLIRFRFRWMKVGPKVMFVKSLVDSFKTTIIVLVSTMNLAVVLQRDAPDSISESLKTQVESNIKFAEDATECLCHHRDAQQDDGSSFTLTLDPSTAIDAGDPTPNAGGELVVLGAAQQSITKTHDSTIIQSGDFDEDDCSLQAAQDCTQIVEMQQMSCAFAKDVLDHQSLKPTWSWNATERLSAHEGSQLFPASDDGYSTADTEGVQVFPASDDYYFTADTEGIEIVPASEDGYSTVDTEAYARASSEEKREGSIRHGEPQERRTPFGKSFEHTRRPDSKAKRSSNPTVDTGVHRQRSSQRDDEEAVRDSSPRQHIPRAENEIFDRLENLLISKEDDDKKAAEKARRDAELAKFDRLESLLISQQEAKIEKERAKKQAAEKLKAEMEESQMDRVEKLLLAQQEAKFEIEKATKEAVEKAMAEAEELGKARTATFIFHDAVGRKFECPWRLCNTWEGMRDFIAKVSSGVAVLSQLIDNGEYDLLKDDLIIPPHLWESMVSPGSSVTMRARKLDSPPVDKKASWFRRSISRGSG